MAGYGPWGCKESDMTEVTEHIADSSCYIAETNTDSKVIILQFKKIKIFLRLSDNLGGGMGGRWEGNSKERGDI